MISNVEPSLEIVYKKIDDLYLKLHVFIPEPSHSDHDPQHALPVIVWFHGGGWNGGTPGQFYEQSAYLASGGALCISVEYRLNKVHGTDPFDAIRDAFDAMRFIRDHAAEWGGDPVRIAAGGGSAGAHLAMATATLTAEDLAGSEEERKKARPDLLLLFNPVFNNSPEDGYGSERLGSRWRDASPAHNLHDSVAPTLVMLGDQDHLIPVSVAEDVSRQLDTLGIENRLVIYPGGTHGFFNRKNHEGRFYTETLHEVEGFLKEQQWL